MHAYRQADATAQKVISVHFKKKGGLTSSPRHMQAALSTAISKTYCTGLT